MTPSHPLIKPSFSLLFPIMQPLSFWQPAWQPVLASLLYRAYVRSYFALALRARALASSDTLVSYVGIICSWFCSLHDWFHDSRSSQSAPAMMFFYKNKTSAVTLIKQFHACNYKVWRFLSCMRVWTPRDRNSEFLWKGSRPSNVLFLHRLRV